MVKLEQKIIDGLYNLVEQGKTDEFLDSLGDGLHLNSTGVENGERFMLFEDGETYTVPYRLGENDGEKEKAIIELYAECGGDFGESEFYEPITDGFYNSEGVCYE